MIQWAFSVSQELFRVESDPENADRIHSTQLDASFSLIMPSANTNSQFFIYP